MSAFQVDDSGALVRTGGSFARVAGLDEIAQGIRTGLQVWLGELPFATDRGMPWPELLEKGVPREILASQVREKISGEPGVLEVLQLEVLDVGPPGYRRAEIYYTARVSTAALAQALLTDTITVAPS